MLNTLSKKLRFPMKDRIQQSPQKVFILLQAAVHRVYLVDFGIRVEQSEIVESSIRILSAIRDAAIERYQGLFERFFG